MKDVSFLWWRGIVSRSSNLGFQTSQKRGRSCRIVGLSWDRFGENCNFAHEIYGIVALEEIRDGWKRGAPVLIPPPESGDWLDERYQKEDHRRRGHVGTFSLHVREEESEQRCEFASSTDGQK